MENLVSELPVGWVEGSTSDLVLNPKNDIVDGPFGSNLKASEYVDSGTPIVRIQNVKRIKFVDKNINFVTNEKAAQLKRHSFLAGDILITKLGEPLGLACVVPDKFEFGIIVADIVRARPYEEVCRKFLTYLLNSVTVIEQISLHTKGSTRARINLSVVRNLSLPIPPVAEQKRIVSKLDQLLVQVDSIQNRLDKLPDVIKRFRQSVLAAAVSGKLTEKWRGENIEPCIDSDDFIDKKLTVVKKKEHYIEAPNTWNWTRFGNHVKLINGDRGKNYPNKAEYVEDGVAFINTGHIEPNGTLSIKRMNFITRDKFESLGSGKIESGDLVYCLRGATMGKTALVDSFSEGAIASSLVIVRPKEHIISKFIYYFLISPQAKDLITRFDNGSAQPNLSAKSLGMYPIALPPLKEQTEIVRLVDKHFALADTLETHLKNAKAKVDNLTQAILAKAFKGELVPQDPNDEPADKLLERIKAARIEAEVLEKAAKKVKTKAKKKSK